MANYFLKIVFLKNLNKQAAAENIECRRKTEKSTENYLMLSQTDLGGA